MAHTVGQVARMTGITVRTLHHYDEIGLLSPAERSPSGYRLYDDAGIERLLSILAYRELGFSLEEITAILGDPERALADHLREQHKLLREQQARLVGMIAAIEKVMEANQMGLSLTPEQQKELFGDWLPDDYAEEAKERWGDSEAYQQSQARAARYTKEQWVQIKAEGDAINTTIADLVRRHEPTDSDAATAVAEEHRQSIIRWFNDVPHAMHVGIGQMYVDDERFRAYYDAIAPGAAEWMRDAIAANAARHMV